MASKKEELNSYGFTISRTTTNQSKPILLIDRLKFLNNKEKQQPNRISTKMWARGSSKHLRCGLGEVANILTIQER